MANLLDFLQSPDASLGINLLAAAAPTMQPMGFGQRLAMGLQATREQQAAEQDRAMRKLLLDAQIANYQGAADERKANLAEKERQAKIAEQVAQWRAGLFAGATPEQALAGGGGPTNANAAKLDAGVSPDVLLARIRAGVAAGLIKPEEAKAIIESQDWGRREVARVNEIEGPGGQKIGQQVDKFGGNVGQPIPLYTAPVQVNQGDRVTFTKPTAGVTLPINMSPSEIDASRRGWAGVGVSQGQLGVAQQRLAHDIQQASGAGGEMVFNADAGGYIPKRLLPGQTPGVVSLPGLAPAKNSPQAQQQASAKLLPILDQAAELLPKATGGYLGTGMDLLGQGLGISTGGAQATAQLKALEGAIVMAQPRMEGPQSDKDTALYRQMAGQIGDSTVPVGTRQAALQVIRQLHEKYAGGNSRPGGATSEWTSGAPTPLPPGAKASQLKKGEVYATPRGNLRWNGLAFEDL